MHAIPIHARARAASLAMLAALALGACGPAGSDPAGPSAVTVSAAASLSDALRDAAGAYEDANPGTRVSLNLASSGTLQQQVERGAPVDLFLAASGVEMDALEAKGMLVPGTRRDFATNEIVLVVPDGRESRVTDFSSLAEPAVGRVSIGAPASVPAGRYAAQTLRTLGIADAVLAKAVLGQHVRQVLAYVERGEVDAGVVYRTDALPPRRVRVVAAAPAGSHEPITYPLAVVARARNPDLARDFAAYLLGPEGAAILRRHGFGTP